MLRDTSLHCGKAVLCLLAEADDDFKYVEIQRCRTWVKALIAELIGGEIARVLNLKCRNSFMLISMKLSDAVKPMKKFRICFKAVRDNLALHYLSGAINFDPVTLVDQNWLPKLFC
jgi:hypothetical protein